MKKRLKAAHLLLLIILLGACTDNGEDSKAVTLAFKFPIGTQYVYSMDSKQTIEQQMAGMNSTISQHMLLQSDYKVDKGDQSNRKLTVNYNRFYIKSASNGTELEYDSADSSKQPAELRSLANLVHHPFSLIIRPDGEIIKVIVDTALQVPDAVKNQFTDSAVRQMMEQSINVYPSKPVKPGDGWQKTYRTNIGFMDMVVASDYKLISVNDGIAHIEINANITSEQSSNPLAQGMRMEMKGTQTGTMDIDVKTGLVQDSEFTQNVSGQMNIPGATIPMKLTSSTRIIGRIK